VSKALALEERAAERCRVHCDEGRAEILSARVDRARDKFFANAGLARYEHRCAEARDASDAGAQFAHDIGRSSHAEIVFGGSAVDIVRRMAAAFGQQARGSGSRGLG